MDISSDDQKILTGMLNNLSLPITITLPGSSGNPNYTWQWHGFSNDPNNPPHLFVGALNQALTQTMNTVIQYAPPSK